MEGDSNIFRVTQLSIRGFSRVHVSVATNPHVIQLKWLRPSETSSALWTCSVVRYLKRTPKGVVQMCEVFDEIRQEGIERDEERMLIAALHSLMERLPHGTGGA